MDVIVQDENSFENFAESLPEPSRTYFLHILFLLKKDVIVQNEKRFKHFPQLPPELRMMITDEMEQKDRVNTSFTSKWCHREARASKYYIYGLELFGFGMDDFRIYVMHGEYESADEKKYGYFLDIKEDRGNKYVICQGLKQRTFWTQKLDKSTNIFEYAINYFKDLLRPRHHWIRKLAIYGSQFANVDFELRSLKSIEDLRIDSDVVARQFLSKISHPLKRLGDFRTPSMSFITECEQLYQVTHRLDLRDLNLTNEQFRKLSATHVQMRIGSLTARNIFDFIQAWQNEPIRGKFGEYKFDLYDRNFDVHRLFRLLGFVDEDVIWNAADNRFWSINDIFFDDHPSDHNPRYFINNHHDNSTNAEISVSKDVLKFWWGPNQSPNQR